MFRPLEMIVAAILVCRPDLDPEVAEGYARVLQAEAKDHDFDPITGVAMIQTESAFVADTISEDGEDYGLGQIRARYVGACLKDPNPKDDPGQECRAVKQRLLDPSENIREIARLITFHRKVCREKVKSAAFPRWLASYQGRNYPKEGRWCVPGKGTWKVIELRKRLIEKAREEMRERRAERRRKQRDKKKHGDSN